MEIRRIKKGEEAMASQIEKACLETPWTEKQIAEMPENSVYLVGADGDIVCAIASMYCVFGEGQIMNIAVSENYRRMGIGEGLLKGLFDFARENNCENITLEVAENNFGAISLYEKCGFNAVGRRKGFYHGVDALVLEKIL